MSRSIIPQQKQGIKTDTVSKIRLNSAGEAADHFEIVKQRLLNVSNWEDFAGKALASFSLTDTAGRELSRPAREGDYFRINIPGPGNKSGEGSDWVQIEQIRHEKGRDGYEVLAMQVRPCESPVNGEKSTAHFFGDVATSTFVVKRKRNSISAEVHGRNEKPNTGTENMVDKIRNLVVGMGALLGFSKIQWKSLVEGLIRKPDNQKG